MALDTQENLIKSVIDQCHRDDLDLKMNDFILLTETEMKSNPSEPLKLNEGETTAALVASTSIRTISLPSGFESSRNFTITIEGSIHPLKYRTPDQLDIRDDTGTPCFFTIRANLIEFDILPDEAYPLTLTYFAAFQPLTTLNQTNIVLTKYPNIYLYGCLRHCFIYAQDMEQSRFYTGEFLSAIESANTAEKEARYATQMQITSSWSP